MIRNVWSHVRVNAIGYVVLSVALAGTGAYAAAPPLALATVTTSTLSQPVDGTQLSYDDQSPPSTVAVAGTTNGVSGETMKLLCDDGGKTKNLFGPDMSVKTDASFSADVPLSAFSAATGPCVLRAVPSTFDPTNDDSSPYHGRRVTVVRFRQRFKFASGPSAGQPADFLVFQQGTNGGSQYFSIADCGLCVSKLFYPSSFTNSAALWSGNAEVFPVEGGTPNRSYLKVDGRNATAPGYDLQWGDGTPSRSLPGLDPLAYSYAAGPGASGVTIHETDHFDRCATASDPSWPPPTKSSCPSFQRTGVRVDRVVVQSSDGTETTIVDSWRSEDARAHDLDLHYDELVEQQGPDKPSYAFPWVSPAYSTHSPGDVIPAPASAPASWLVSGDSGAPDGSALYPQGALTFDPVPDAILFRGSGDPLLRYHRTIPAGGSLGITQVFDMARTRAAVGAAALAARDRLSPPPAATGGGGALPNTGGALPAFGTKTLVTLRLAAGRIPARGPLKVRVANANGFTITGKLSGQTTKKVSASRKRRIKLKAKSFSVAAHARKTVKLKLPKALRRLLKRKRKLSLRLTAKLKDPAGHTRSVKKTVKPKLKKKKRKRSR